MALKQFFTAAEVREAYEMGRRQENYAVFQQWLRTKQRARGDDE